MNMFFGPFESALLGVNVGYRNTPHNDSIAGHTLKGGVLIPGDPQRSDGAGAYWHQSDELVVSPKVEPAWHGNA